MPVSFEGFPRVVERETMKPGRWFVAADGSRPIICFSTDEGGDGPERLILTFGTTRPETLDFSPTTLKSLSGPLATLEYDVVFAPGLAPHTPQLTAPLRRPFRPGALLRMRSGDLALGFASDGGALACVSMSTGLRSEGYELVFDRWTLSLRRAGTEMLVGAYRPL